MKNFINLIIATIILTNCHAQGTKLMLNLEKGKEYKQFTNSKMTMAQDFNGQKINIEMSIKGKMSYNVKTVNKTDYEMDVYYESLSMSMELPQGRMEFSSENKNDKDIFSTILADMINNSFQITMTKTGKVTKVKNINLLFDSMFKKFPQIPENELTQIKTQLMNAYGEKAFRGNIEMVTAIYPDKLVNKGESWEVKTKLESGMSGNITSTYKFAEENINYFLIIGRSKITTQDKEAYIQANGFPTRYNMSGNMYSNIKIDRNTGWIIEAKVNQHIKGDVYIKEIPELSIETKVPMEMKNEMAFTNK